MQLQVLALASTSTLVPVLLVQIIVPLLLISRIRSREQIHHIGGKTFTPPQPSPQVLAHGTVVLMATVSMVAEVAMNAILVPPRRTTIATNQIVIGTIPSVSSSRQSVCSGRSDKRKLGGRSSFAPYGILLLPKATIGTVPGARSSQYSHSRTITASTTTATTSTLAMYSKSHL